MKPHNIQTIASSAVSSPTGKGRRRLAAGLVRAFFGVASVLMLVAPVADAGETPVEETPATLPAFLFQPLYASNQGAVYGVYEARHADLVLLQGGFDSGFRTGMVCRITNGDTEVGEVMLVEVRNNCAAAIILQLEAGQIVEPGHSVRIKTVKF